MRVTFPRLPDYQRAYALVERDDGVVYRLYGGIAGPQLPHDIMHLIAERELRIRDGIWAGIAAGVVFTSMGTSAAAARRTRPSAPATCCAASRRKACAPNSSPTWCPASRRWTL